MPDDVTSVRYMVDNVDTAVDFYTKHLGFEVLSSAAPAFADVRRGNLRLLLSGPTSSAGRPMPDGERPAPGGWNRIHFVCEDIDVEIARVRRPASHSATTWSQDQAAGKSSCRIPPVT